MGNLKIGDIDLVELKRQREVIQGLAYGELATRVAQVEELLREIKEISETTGVEVGIYDIQSLVTEIRDGSDWNSSGC